MAPPKIPAKRRAVNEDEDLPFGDTPFTDSEDLPPKAPARARKKTKAPPPTPTRRSTRGMSEVATED
jgi:hypothetical protein